MKINSAVFKKFGVKLAYLFKEYIDDQHVRDIYTQAMVDRINSGVLK